MAHIEFTDNYQDLSTDQGFQFKFFCKECGNGYMSTWKANTLGVTAGLLRGAGDLLGGVFGRAASGTYEVQRAIGGPAHDSALKDAVEEIRPLFLQCKRCGSWVCQEICWNPERALCKNCAPILRREIAAKQAEIAVEQATDKIRQQDLTAGVDLESPATVLCPKCGAEAGGGKFCQECGASLAAKVECPRCGAKLKENAKFCAECGQKLT